MLWNAAQDYPPPRRKRCKEKVNRKRKRERKRKLGLGIVLKSTRLHVYIIFSIILWGQNHWSSKDPVTAIDTAGWPWTQLTNLPCITSYTSVKSPAVYLLNCSAYFFLVFVDYPYPYSYNITLKNV
jgi:hypothetical protein